MRRRHKSHHTIEVAGKWWCGGKWVDFGDINGKSACSCRYVRTLNKLDKVFKSTEGRHVVAEAHFYHSGKRGKGWILKYSAEKTMGEQNVSENG